MRAGPPGAAFVTAAELLDDEVASVVDPVRLIGRIRSIEDQLRALSAEHRQLAALLAGRA